MKIRISRRTLQYIITTTKEYITHAWGVQDENGLYENGIIDQLNGDTEAYRFVNSTIRFLRYLVGILEYAVQEADDDQPDFSGLSIGGDSV